MDSDRTDSIVQEFMGDKPTADELRVWRSALERRLSTMRDEAAADPAAAEALRPKIQQVAEQVRVLRDEEAITDFVEESVRAAVANAGPVGPEDAPHDTTLPPWASLDFDDVPE